VAQERRPARSPSEHRGGHRGSGGINSRPSPHSPQRAAYATAVRAPISPQRPRLLPPSDGFAGTVRGWDRGAVPLSRRGAPPASLAPRLSFFGRTKERLRRRPFRFTRFQVSADNHAAAADERQARTGGVESAVTAARG
jgi:hypothetical protein